MTREKTFYFFTSKGEKKYVADLDKPNWRQDLNAWLEKERQNK